MHAGHFLKLVLAMLASASGAMCAPNTIQYLGFDSNTATLATAPSLATAYSLDQALKHSGAGDTLPVPVVIDIPAVSESNSSDHTTTITIGENANGGGAIVPPSQAGGSSNITIDTKKFPQLGSGSERFKPITIASGTNDAYDSDLQVA